MTKFKVGDRVKILFSVYQKTRVGDVGSVIELQGAPGNGIFVRARNGNRLYFQEADLKLIPNGLETMLRISFSE